MGVLLLLVSPSHINVKVEGRPIAGLEVAAVAPEILVRRHTPHTTHLSAAWN